MTIGKDLNFDMARLDDQLFNQAMIVAKAAGGFSFATDKGILEIGGFFNRAHAFAAATRRCLDQNRISDLVCFCGQKIRVLIFGVITGNQRNTRLAHDFLGFGFRSHRADRTCRWANKDTARFFKGICKPCIFRQETITRVNRICPRLCNDIKQTINAQIAVFRGWTAYVIGLVGPSDMQGIGIRVGINRDGLDAHAACGFNHAAGNFTTVGDQYFAQHD